MSDETLDVPWAERPPDLLAQPPMDHVNVLPGFASSETETTPETLHEPWESQRLDVPHEEPIASLKDVVL